MRRAVLALAAALAAVSLTACGDDRECAEWQTTTVLVPVVIGKVVTLIPTQTSVCDRYIGEAP
jgi:hypothetical protein